jgi:hypothetical protein
VGAQSWKLVRIASVAAAVAALPVLASTAGAQRQRPAVGQVRIEIKPTVVTVGAGANVSGGLQGSAPGNKPLLLQGAEFPFQAFGERARGGSDRQGRYHFRVSPRVNTRFQVISTTAPPVASQIVSLTVKQKVDARVSDTTPRKRGRIYFSGDVTPARPGAVVYIQRQSVNTGRFRTISRTLLVDAGPDRSSFRKKVRITRSAVYAVRVRGTDQNAQGFSGPIPLRVH